MNKQKENMSSQPQSDDLSPRKFIPTIIITFVITALFLLFVGQFVKVNGSSMTPTYTHGQTLFIEKISTSYDRFDVVTLQSDGALLIKRVIALPGETVQIIDGKVYVNDEVLDDCIDVIIDDAGIAKEKLTLNSDEYFVLGDNRNNSADSRSAEVGPIKKTQIFGRVLFTLF